MYGNDIKDVQKYIKRCTSFNNSVSTLLKTSTDESKKNSINSIYQY